MKTKNTTEHRCGLYCRVSTDMQAAVEDGSLDAQIARLQDYVRFENRSESENWEVVDVYREEGKSGKNLNRPEFERMMQDTETGRINTIIFCKLDRFTRSLKDFLDLWPVLEERNIQVISLNEKWDTASAIGKAMLRMSLVWAELEREQTGERTSASLVYRASQGRWNGGRILGYDPDLDTPGGLKVNDEFAPVVTVAYEKCVELQSAGRVTKWLNENGYRMPVYQSRRGKAHGGDMFTKPAVIRLLTNSTYTGKLHWKGEIYNGKHKPLVEQELFDRVQRIISSNRYSGNRKPKKLHVHILQGLLRCGKCGTTMTPTWSSGRSKVYCYYGCSRRQHIGKEACDSTWVPAESIENLVLERVRELAEDTTQIDAMVEQANARQSEMLRKLATDQTRLKRQIQDTKEKLASMVNAIESDGSIAFRSLKDRMQALEVERAAFEEQLKQVKFEACRIREETLSATVMADSFKRLVDAIDHGTPQEVHTLLQQLVEVIEWHEDPENPGSGHYRIAYFEQPRLGLKKESPTGPSGYTGAVGSNDWLRRLGSNQQPSG